MFRFLKAGKRARILRRNPIDESLWEEALARLPILKGFSEESAGRLRDTAALFLHDKIFEPVQGLEMTDAMRVVIAAQACLPIANLDYDWYRGWRTVVVYPGQFVRPRRELDDIGVMHEWSDILQGESWELGPVILSWADVEASGSGEGYNVIIHEMAHKLDMLNGEADGFPPLHRGMPARVWTETFRAAFRDLNAQLDRGVDPPIDPYAADSPGEYFAVVSEYFFEQPALILAKYPDVYAQLRQFYRQDPAGRLPTSP